MPSLGIGIITFNRRDLVAETIDRVRALTRQADACLVVADDASTDGTQDMVRGRGVALVTGENFGVAWNKNRALFLLNQLVGCETVILLEDDAQPEMAGWETEWLEASRLWGHANYAGLWTRDHALPGAGTIDDPVLSPRLDGRCSCFSREALAYCGFFDPRFKGYGHEHIEHSNRLGRAGYGATRAALDGVTSQFVYRLIRGRILEKEAHSHFNQEQSDRNFELARSLLDNQAYSAPWSTLLELRRFRGEMQVAMAAGPDIFALRGSGTQIVVRLPEVPARQVPPSPPRPAPPIASAPRAVPQPTAPPPLMPVTPPQTGPSRNLALGCPTLQSSVSDWSNEITPEADSAGAVNGRFDHAYGFHTAEEDQPWWQVDLRQPCAIDAVVVYNRLEHPVIASRASPLCILLSMDGTVWTSVFTSPPGETIGGRDGNPLTWRPPAPTVARYLRLQVLRRSMLHLVQVEVYGTAVAQTVGR
ncbi:MAG: discoidin domain-containing protein [Acetobacteraceae bacterium]